MPPGRSDLMIPRGETWEELWTWTDDGDVPFDLTGYHAALELRVAPEDANAAIRLDDQGAGGIVLGGAAGTITITASATQTDALVHAYYRWDFALTDAAGAVLYLVGGKVTMLDTITEP